MMRGKVEPFIVPTVVRAVPLVVQVVKQTLAVPKMKFPQERQLREQR
jgi:hypothetical protein